MSREQLTYRGWEPMSSEERRALEDELNDRIRDERNPRPMTDEDVEALAAAARPHRWRGAP
jgi:hypothetical protein